ncbi:ABATE domain-containing protein [Inquilinus sp. Marseille-Q2685]|uniref:CGNR zinc finger domain-containing protein n=1 Tax=Inquilinus sp. Marseille-Q2685 TaxID=2866581 RepID=UPI001CE49A4D|nr:ABATE domain-containing protein [Inquilinus sp. Marseille-Q2685]
MAEAAGSQDELCIRFVNTMAWRRRQPGEERLPTPDALLRWLGAAGLDPAGIAPDRAAALHDAALALREAICRSLLAVAAGEAPTAGDLALLHARLAGPPSGMGAEIAPAGGGVAWRAAPADPLGLLRPVALSAAALLTGPRARRVRQCQDEQGCGWLFIDESRAQNRRWCSMGDCGNRAKARRHRARLRARAERG